MRDINPTRLSTHLLTALLLFLAGFSMIALLALPIAGVVFFIAGLMFVTLAFTPTSRRPEE